MISRRCKVQDKKRKKRSFHIKRLTESTGGIQAKNDKRERYSATLQRRSRHFSIIAAIFLELRTLKRLSASNKETAPNTFTESSSLSSISFQDTVSTSQPTETVAPSFIKLYNKYTLVSNSFVRILFVYNISRIFSHATATKSISYERKRT